MVVGITTLAVAATVYGAYNTYKQGQEQAEALRRQAELDQERADEFLLRTEKNIKARRVGAEKIIGGQKVALAEAGIEIGAGVSLEIMEDAYESLAEEEELVRSEAAYQAAAIRSGAEAQTAQAKDVEKAAKIQAVTSLIGGAAIAAK